MGFGCELVACVLLWRLALRVVELFLRCFCAELS